MKLKRKYILGEQWVYLKMYGGSKFLERILVQEVFDQLHEWIHKEIIDHFFFIRYADPDYHIRLRLFTKDTNNVCTIINSLNMIMTDKIENRSVYKICYDTYNREIERYGDNSTDIVEKLFFIDSISILRFLALANCTNENRWLYSMVWIDQLLDLFRFREDRKSTFYESMYENYAFEFGIKKPAKVTMDKKYRKLTGQIEYVFYENKAENKYEYISRIVSSYEENSKYLVSQLLNMESKDALKVTLNSLVSSIIHMHVNRMFRTQQRKYELLLYYLLFKFNKSRIARTRMS